MTILVGFLKAMIIMISFGFLYEVFVDIFHSLYQSMSSVIVNASEQKLASDLRNVGTTIGEGFNIVGNLFTLVYAILLCLIYFQNLGRGIEMLILRLGLPFACIGLLNADGGAFKGYTQKMIKVAFTVIVQLLLIQLSIVFILYHRIILALATGLMAYRTPGLLNEFMATSGGGYFGMRNIGSTVTRGTIVKNSLFKGKG